jgi:hypothetical protein
MKKVIQSISIAIGIGSSIYMAMGVLFTEGAARNNIAGVLIMSCVIGLISCVHNSERLSLFLKTAIQFVGSLSVFLITAIVNQWFPIKPAVIFTAVTIFVILFFVSWAGFYIMNKLEIDKINKEISKRENGEI